MTKEELNKETAAMEKELEEILPEDWNDRFETHEDLYGLFERAFEKADAIAYRAIKLLKLLQN